MLTPAGTLALCAPPAYDSNGAVRMRPPSHSAFLVPLKSAVPRLTCGRLKNLSRPCSGLRGR